MDFNDTPEEAQFRLEARAWLDDNAEKRVAGKIYKLRRGEEGLMPLARDWERRKFEGGFAGIAIAKEYGGRGGTRLQQITYQQEEANYVTPPPVFNISHGMAVPVLLAYASEAQKSHFVPATLRGDHLWCQLFSEPGAGSDLAGLRTRAVKDGEEWVVNGQKIWNSGAQFADYGLLVTRSDADVPKHKGLTYFFIDMKSPGIEVRPIKQMQGYSNFNEVFLTDLRIPDSQRLGEVGEGWRVAIATLMNERVVSAARPAPKFADVFGLARELALEDGPAIADPAVREKLAHWYVQARGVELINYRSITALARGQQPGPENSISKLVGAYNRQQMAHFGMDLMDMGGAIFDRDESPMQALFQDALLDSPSGRIAAGTDEILRNIIGERVLGLPREERSDTKKPFNELRAND